MTVGEARASGSVRHEQSASSSASDQNALSAMALELFDQAAAVSADGNGISRPSYSSTESDILALLDAFAIEHGLTCQRDRAANAVFQIGDGDPDHYVLIGSHVDSVPRGGNYDGLAGVIAGLLVLADLRIHSLEPRFPVRVIALRGEESAWFGRACVGSRALTGQLSSLDLKAAHRETGRSLEACMKSVGAETAAIAAQEPLLDLRRVRTFLEMHIEQGPVLVERALPVAVVTGIRGNVRHRQLRCVGEGGHSGAVPRWLRRDAVFAVSDLIMRLDEHWQTIQQHGGDLVVTVGMLHTDRNHDAMSRVPGEVDFSFEARSESRTTLDALEALLRSECETLERLRNVRFEFDAPIRSAPAKCDVDIVNGLRQACVAEGFADETVPSGAGHDAAIFSNAGVPSGMLFIRNEHGSHNPDEAMSIEDFMAGYSVLRRFILDNG